MLSNCGAREDLKVPWTARKSNQSILKDISPEYLLEGLMLKLKSPYFVHLMQRAGSLEKTLMLKKIEVRRRRGQQRTTCLDGITDSMDMSLNKLQEMVKNRKGQGSCSLWGRKESNMTKQLNNNYLCSSLNQTHVQELDESENFVTQASLLNSIKVVVVSQLLRHVQLSVTLWIAACQAFLSFTISWSLLTFMFFELVMPTNHLILCYPLLLLPSVFPSIRVFSSKSALHIRWPKYWSFSTNASNE